MTDDEVKVHLNALQRQGKSVDDVAAIAVAWNVDLPTLIQLLRDLYGLSLTEASSAATSARHGPKYALPHHGPFEGLIDRVVRVRSGEGWVITLKAVTGAVRVGQQVQLWPVNGGVGVYRVLAVNPSSTSAQLVLTLSGTDVDLRSAAGGRVTADGRSPPVP